MTWRVFVTAASDPDFVGLSSAERGAINEVETYVAILRVRQRRD